MEATSKTKKQLLDALRGARTRIASLEKKAARCRGYEILLRETHHRVRNNMQVISSLLRLQERSLKDESAIEAFKVCQNRIRSMALVHEKLCLSKDLEKIEMAEFIQDLATHLFLFYGVNPNDIKLVTDMEEHYIDINRAVPFFLIVNELLSNALKHAFPDGKKGEIKIQLHPIDEEKFRFVLSDNGIGLPGDGDIRGFPSLGLKLVSELIDQIDGDIELNRRKGTTVIISC